MSGLCFALQSKRKFDPKGEHALPLMMMRYDTFHSFLLLSLLVPFLWTCAFLLLGCQLSLLFFSITSEGASSYNQWYFARRSGDNLAPNCFWCGEGAP